MPARRRTPCHALLRVSDVALDSVAARHRLRPGTPFVPKLCPHGRAIESGVRRVSLGQEQTYVRT